MSSEQVKQFNETGELLYKPQPLFKVSFENVNTAKVGYFYINGIDEILSSDVFNRTIRDAKSGEEYTIKKSILRQLEEIVIKESDIV